MGKFKNILMLDEKGEKGLRRAIIACTITSLSLMIPFFLTIQAFIEILKPLEGGEISWSKMWLIFSMGFGAFVVIFLFSKREYKSTYVNAYGQSEATRLQIADYMRKLPMSFFNAKDLSELSSNIMSDCSNIEQMLSSAIPQLAANIISSALVCLLLMFFDWRMALAVFISLPVAALIFWLSRKLQSKMFAGHVQAKLSAIKQSQEYLDGIKVIRSCGLGGSKFKKLDDAFLDLKRISLQVELVSGVAMSVSSIVLRAGVGIVAFVGVNLLSGGVIGFIPLLMFLLIATRVYAPILTVLTLLPDMLYLQISTQRLRTLMGSAPMEGSREKPVENYEIELRKVSFAYNDRNVLTNVSMIAREGQVTALVGPSGSGKSTIARLAARFWDAQCGEILVGGINIKEVDPEHLMKHISFVFQEVTLFNDTIAENIRLGKPAASDEEVKKAARLACCDEFIEKLPDAYQTVLGENGTTISGGERQRISIARALLKDAPIILLDEATSSLDPENEVLVQKALGRLIKGRTVLVIAHRLRTVSDADKIVVLSGGEIIEQGTHHHLLDSCSLYKRLWDLQQESGAWSVSP
ncbi:ATP-binding cassette subfamily B protein [Ruminiclostridium sufflavum DSM 19573]|uniref:ATP-binding cassette subfamily B protein n=1 Tax=Ruminiclostridium sufflavum DSM 19573 TaxID=1121337 RepID=A0A318XQZ4_9FIRM|nr:ABC transporter ATP-binding protein [Ruminiclostridium sufflavum]PYG89743.1 ATP-binding cassette subfamily B protein [Ruminiclostridium sufflavum DSM 19573]